MSINFAIIGCGKIAWRHAENIKKYGAVVAVCERVVRASEGEVAVPFGGGTVDDDTRGRRGGCAPDGQGSGAGDVCQFVDGIAAEGQR